MSIRRLCILLASSMLTFAGTGCDDKETPQSGEPDTTSMPDTPVVSDSQAPDLSAADPGEDIEEDVPPGEPALCINELMPSNVGALADETAAFPDWIELHNPGQVEIALEGWRISDDRDRPDRHVFGNGLVVPAGGYVLLFADGRTHLGPDHLSFKINKGGEEVVLWDPEGHRSIVEFGKLAADVAMARIPDCCTPYPDCARQVPGGTPGAENTEEPVRPPPAEEVELIARSSQWSYLDTGVAAGVGWTHAGFDDATWKTGSGPLGYGDGHIVTTVEWGPGPDKAMTTYFRHVFTATDTESFTGLRLSVMRDDGAVVYLNGVEILRPNMPEGPIAHDTPAATSVGGPDEATYFDADIEGTLAEGKNVVAVEVHQSDAASSDLAFDLGLVAKRPAPAEPPSR